MANNRKSENNDYSGYYNAYHNAYYSNTSEAHDVSTVPQIKRVIKRKKSKKRRSIYYEYALGTIIYPRFIYIVLSLIFIGCVISVFAYSLVWSYTRSIVSLQNEINIVKENVALLEADSTISYDLNKIEEIAKTRLHMSFPEQHQIVYISVPNESYIEQYTLESTNVTDMSLASVVNDFIKEWFNGTSKKSS